MKEYFFSFCVLYEFSLDCGTSCTMYYMYMYVNQFSYACVEITKLISKFNISDIRTSGNLSIIEACSNGNLYTLQWLHKTFTFNVDDLRINNNQILNIIVINNYY